MRKQARARWFPQDFREDKESDRNSSRSAVTASLPLAKGPGRTRVPVLNADLSCDQAFLGDYFITLRPMCL